MDDVGRLLRQIAWLRGKIRRAKELVAPRSWEYWVLSTLQHAADEDHPLIGGLITKEGGHMTKQEFDESRVRLNALCEGLLGTKSEDYTQGGDRLSNFNMVGAALGLVPLEVWGVYFLKHVLAIQKFVRTGGLADETLESRFADARNYLDLGYALVMQQEQAGISSKDTLNRVEAVVKRAYDPDRIDTPEQIEAVMARARGAADFRPPPGR